MRESEASPDPSASELISRRIAELGDWRGETLAHMRRLIRFIRPISSRNAANGANPDPRVS